jgi:hypothetical protein
MCFKNTNNASFQTKFYDIFLVKYELSQRSYIFVKNINKINFLEMVAFFAFILSEN